VVPVTKYLVGKYGSGQLPTVGYGQFPHNGQSESWVIDLLQYQAKRGV
jgi:hypothetical protein